MIGIATLRDVAREKSTYTVTVSFFDENGTALAPTTAVWTLSKLDGTIVNSRENVSIASPGTEEVIVLTGSDLAIIDGDELEARALTVLATYSSGRTIKSEARFWVRNLTKVS